MLTVLYKVKILNLDDTVRRNLLTNGRFEHFKYLFLNHFYYIFKKCNL